jgi:hypothetical protein
LPISSPLHDHPNNICRSVKLWSSSLCSLLQTPDTSFLLDPHTLPSTLLSDTHNQCPSASMRPSFTLIQKTDELMVSYVLIFKFIVRRWENKTSGLNDGKHFPNATRT